MRVRPRGDLDGQDATVTAVDTDTNTISLESGDGSSTNFHYDKIYNMESTQEQLYTDSVSPIIEQVCRGMSSAVFAYGQTGTGKTYTMRGDLSDNAASHGKCHLGVRIFSFSCPMMYLF